MEISEDAKNRVLNSKTGVGLGMMLVGLLAAGSLARAKHQKNGQHAAGKNGRKDD